MQAECSDILAQLESWYARANGQYLLQSTRHAVQDWLDTSFGYHILQLGLSGGRPLYEGSPINHRIYSAENAAGGVSLVSQPDELPLESDSIDTVIIHHCLEFARNPHQVLREAHRVLTPHGQMLVIGFNPYSLVGVNARVRRLLRDPLWGAHRPVSESRLTDWLRLLHCEVLDAKHLFSLPPAPGGRLRQWSMRADAWCAKHNLPGGGVYIVHATKQVAGLHASRRARLSRGGRLIGLVPKPVTSPNTPVSKSSNAREKGDVAA